MGSKCLKGALAGLVLMLHLACRNCMDVEEPPPPPDWNGQASAWCADYRAWAEDLPIDLGVEGDRTKTMGCLADRAVELQESAPAERKSEAALLIPMQTVATDSKVQSGGKVRPAIVELFMTCANNFREALEGEGS
jgi:hypothetical protein